MKSVMKRVSLLLSAVMLSATVMTGCSSSGEVSSETAQSSSTDALETASSDEIPTLTWYMPGNPTAMTSEGYEAVSEELNRYLEEKIGCHLELKIFAFSEYAQKCSTVISSGEPFDLMFTCDWLNNFATNAGSNAYLPLNDLLEANAPEAMADIPEYMWQATTIDGNIYAMPALQTYAKNDGLFLRADIAEQLGVEGSSYENGADTYTLEDVGNMYAELVQEYPGVIPDDCGGILWTYLDEYYGFNFLGGFDVPGVVRFSDEGTVIDQFQSEEFMEYCKTVYDWVQKGYMQPDYATYVTMTDQITIDRKSPDHMTYRQGFTAPNVASMAVSDCGWEEEPVPVILSEKYAVTSGVTQSLTAVGINSKYPEKAVQLYNLAYSDPYFVNTMIYGIEGVNYTKISDTEVDVIQDSNYVRPLEPYAIANQFITWVQAGAYPADMWEQIQAFCEDATPSELFGFIFDSSSVKSEVANCSAIYEEYKYPLLCGAVDPETAVPELLSRMEAAGSAKIIEEMQRQVDEFLANK
ncbi:MAG: ABC transporter substrate-binding protein [Eubacteriales bacterium]|nr:ABC transporter substrate-binding protein [Eubacteriales bacterium]